MSALRPKESVTIRRWSRLFVRADRGSVLLLMVFACLAVAVVLAGAKHSDPGRRASHR